MSRRRWLALGWLLVLGLSAALPLSAVFRGVIHVGNSALIVRTPLTQPLIAIASTVDLRQGTHSLVVALGGDIRLHGTARDDLVALGGRIYLAPNSRVQGDVLTIVGGIYRAPNVVVGGRLGGALHPWNGSTEANSWNLLHLAGGSVRLGLAAGLALLLAGTCLTIVFPWQIVLISTTLRRSPLKSVGAAAMILLTFTFLVVPLGLSLAGLPFAVLLTAAASLAWLFGMTAFAVLVGRLLARGAASLIWAAAAGLVSLAVVMAVPVLGPVVVSISGLIGAGALAVSLISRAYPVAPLA